MPFPALRASGGSFGPMRAASGISSILAFARGFQANAQGAAEGALRDSWIAFNPPPLDIPGMGSTPGIENLTGRNNWMGMNL